MDGDRRHVRWRRGRAECLVVLRGNTDANTARRFPLARCSGGRSSRLGAGSCCVQGCTVGHTANPSATTDGGSRGCVGCRLRVLDAPESVGHRQFVARERHVAVRRHLGICVNRSIRRLWLGCTSLLRRDNDVAVQHAPPCRSCGSRLCCRSPWIRVVVA